MIIIIIITTTLSKTREFSSSLQNSILFLFFSNKRGNQLEILNMDVEWQTNSH